MDFNALHFAAHAAIKVKNKRIKCVIFALTVFADEQHARTG